MPDLPVESSVPEGMKVQLARLFGSTSREAQASSRSAAQWRKTFRRVTDELERYIETNVNTDELHFFLLLTCILAARESLKEDNFIIGYSEAITRLALLLMGDYPDHRRRAKGMKRGDHYKLDQRRRLSYSQNQSQKV